jgi:hypothetical protein
VGRARLTGSSGARPLFNRLRQHARSIEVAGNLHIEDFSCRFLVLHPVWVSTVEDLLIEHFDTLWNGVIKGFGVHDPGGKRHEGELPLWDTIHPGRSHAKTMLEKGAKAQSVDDIAAAIESFVSRRAAHESPLPITPEHADHVLRQAQFEDDEA